MRYKYCDSMTTIPSPATTSPPRASISARVRLLSDVFGLPLTLDRRQGRYAARAR
jgi:hypothetical protein